VTNFSPTGFTAKMSVEFKCITKEEQDYALLALASFSEERFFDKQLS
jgi:hypothetical protein